jgi:hypothetical protein
MVRQTARCTDIASSRRRLVLPVALTALALAACTASAVAESRNLDEFAQCLTNKGATMYGASWCPVCKAQLKAFGSAAQNLQYVECSIDGSWMPTEDCTDANVTKFPTWTFSDGSRLSGLLTMDRLSKKTGCRLPAEGATKPAKRAAQNRAAESPAAEDGEAPPDDSYLPPRRLDPHL